MKVDYLIVGSGLTGATMARLLADAGQDVLVLERRPHIGGNVYDHVHPAGIRVHTYGPHYFRTDSEEIWQFATRFADFYPFEATIMSEIDGAYESWPISGEYIGRTIGHDWQPEFRGTPANFEESSLSMMPRIVYEKFVKGYTEKQWGVPATNLDCNLARRFDVRRDNDPRLVRSKYQGLPADGYASWISKMLAGIPVMLNFDYLKARASIQPKRLLIFTGPIDEFFGFDLGRLEYRAQIRSHTYFPRDRFILPCGQVNNPSPKTGPHVRTIEWKHMMPAAYASRIEGTVLTREVPSTPLEPEQYEYPFPSAPNRNLYERYLRRAQGIPGLLVCGRLGEYRYYDMDSAIMRASNLVRPYLVNLNRN